METTAPRFMSPRDVLPDWRLIAGIIWAQRVIVCVIAAMISLPALIIIAWWPPVYQATATLIFGDDAQLARFGTMDPIAVTPATLQAAASRLNAPDLLLRSAQTVRLLPITMNEKDSTDLIALTQIARRLQIRAQIPARSIEVSFRDQNPRLAAQMANTHVTTYLKVESEIAQKNLEQMQGDVRHKIERIKADIAQRAEGMSNFRRARDLPENNDGSNPWAAQIDEGERQLERLRLRRDEITAQLEGMANISPSAMKENASLIDQIQSPALDRLRAAEAEQSRQVTALRARLGPNHPTRRAAERTLGNTRTALREEALRSFNMLQHELEASESQIQMLSDRVALLGARATDLSRDRVILSTLQKEQQAAQKSLDSLLTQDKNLSSTSDMALRPVAQLTAAAIPITPLRPSKSLLILAVCVFSFGSGMVSVLVWHFVRGRVVRFEDVRALGLRPLGVVPCVAEPISVWRGPFNSTLRTALDRLDIPWADAATEGKALVFLVTSALPDEGGSTLSALLGLHRQEMGKRVLLIDADHHRPQLAALLPEHISGLRLIHLSDLGDVEHDLTTLRTTYDTIIIDGGPTLARAAVMRLAPLADFIITVAAWNTTRIQDVRAMRDLLLEAGKAPHGVVLNQVDLACYKDMVSTTDFLLPRAMPRAA